MAGIHIPNPAHEAEKAIDHIIKPAIDAGKKAIWDSRHAAYEAVKGVGERAEKSVLDAEHTAEKSILSAKQKAVADLQTAGKDLLKGLEEAKDNDLDLIHKAGDKVKDEIKDWLKSEAGDLTVAAIHKGLEEAHVVALAIEKAIDRLEEKAPTIVDMLNNQSLPINLGPLVLTYANGVSRIHDIADAIGKVTGDDFQLTQEFINDLLNGLGPDTISIHADVEFFVEVGVDLDDIPFAAFVEIADIVFEALGVPEK